MFAGTHGENKGSAMKINEGDGTNNRKAWRGERESATHLREGAIEGGSY